jgi:YidC/Oxa1 family membrane protein insertase
MFPLASIFTDIPEAIVLFFHDTVGLGCGPSIIALTFTVRLAIVPLSIKQIRSMRALQALSPQLKAIQERYKDDRQRQQQEMMKFYQENNINPLASCLPLLLQLPVFFALYAMLNGESFKEDVRETSEQGWLFIDSVIEKPEGLAVTATLIILFIGTQLLAGLAMSVRGQGLEGPQRFIVFGLPFAFAPFVATFPMGLSIYWISTNIWTFAQQQVVLSLMPPPEKPTEEELEAITKPPPPPPRRKKKKSGRRR